MSQIKYEEILMAHPILETERLLLRPFTLDDAEDVFEYAKDDEVTKYLSWSTHKSIVESKAVIKDFYLSKLGIYAIELKSENKCIGCFELRLTPKHDKASFGYVLNKNYWQQGYMTEVLQLVIDFGFNNLKLNRIGSTFYKGNYGSGRVMEKCYMTYEGTIYQAEKKNGVYHDVIHYGILRQDWLKNNEKIHSI